MTTVEELYPQIAQTMVDAIPEAWDTAWVMVELKPGVISTQGHYQLLGAESPVSFRVPHQTLALFNQLHAQMVETMQADWKRARFDLKSTGKFDLSFEY